MTEDDEFWGGIWWVKAPDAFGLRSASPGECCTEIKRLRVREAHLLSVIRDYNSDDALFDHEKGLVDQDG